MKFLAMRMLSWMTTLCMLAASCQASSLHRHGDAGFTAYMANALRNAADIEKMYGCTSAFDADCSAKACSGHGWVSLAFPDYPCGCFDDDVRGHFELPNCAKCKMGWGAEGNCTEPILFEQQHKNAEDIAVLTSRLNIDEKGLPVFMETILSQLTSLAATVTNLTAEVATLQRSQQCPPGTKLTLAKTTTVYPIAWGFGSVTQALPLSPSDSSCYLEHVSGNCEMDCGVFYAGASYFVYRRLPSSSSAEQKGCMAGCSVRCDTPHLQCT
eukprot:ANDGO_06507.mRNA.1 hypothetical protein